VTNPAVRYPFRFRISATVGIDGGSERDAFSTWWVRGWVEVSMLTWEGRVHEACAKAFTKRVPCPARLSRKGEVSRR